MGEPPLWAVLGTAAVSMTVAATAGALVARHLIRRFSTGTYEGTLLGYAVEKHDYDHERLVGITMVATFFVTWLACLTVADHLLSYFGYA